MIKDGFHNLSVSNYTFEKFLQSACRTGNLPHIEKADSLWPKMPGKKVNVDDQDSNNCSNFIHYVPNNRILLKNKGTFSFLINILH